MEIELRARVQNLSLLEEKIKSLEGVEEKKSEERQTDIYMKHENDETRKMIIRIRKKYNKEQAILTFKGSAPKNQEDIAWEDFDTAIENPDNLERLLINNGYTYVCLIDKVRQSFQYKEFEINIDNVRDLGIFIEIEKNANENEIQNVKNEITNLLNQLGIQNDDLITKGYVPLMIELSQKNK